MEKHDQVDVVSISGDGSTVVLSMVETRPWDARGEHLLDLQAKLSSYLGYVESGQLLERCPQAKGKRVLFRLDSAYPLSNHAVEFIRVAQTQWLDPLSISFETGELGGNG
jgi:hypothetical protein